MSSEPILDRVRKPGRYVGHEWNSIRKDHSQVEVKVALAYPDTYEVGLSNLGFSILYDLINARADALAERVYAPWSDMEEEMRQGRARLGTLESGLPLSGFDIVGFTLQHEMNFTNILTMLDLGGVPLKADERTEEHPIVAAGGPCAFNPEPVARFFDAFVIGDGEEVVGELIDAYRSGKAKKEGRADLLKRLSDVEGVYVPTLQGPGKVVKRRTVDLNDFRPPVKPPVPYVEIVHDRFAVEVMRGCTRSCRFCQAGMIYRPVRERAAETVKECALEGLKSTGYDEVSLVSLSSADYSSIVSVARDLALELVPRRIAISLPSLRVDSFSVELAEEIGKSKQSSLTFAPEAGSQRLRDVINKGITEDDLTRTAETAFRAGWRKLKLYFMIGLPTETEGDLDAIVSLAGKIVDRALAIVPRQEHRRVDITVSVSSFIPKAHTPFQWAAQNDLQTLKKKIDRLRLRLRRSHIVFKWQDPRMSKLEAALARGGQEVGRAIERAWRLGCRFDSWTESFDFDRWKRAFADADLSMEEYSDRERALEEELPWDRIDAGVTKEWLASEQSKAFQGERTEDCRFARCVECGVC